MPTATPLQEALFKRMPEMHWLLDPEDRLIEPLFRQWGVQALQSNVNAQTFSSMRMAFSWAAEKNVQAQTLQSTFNWLHNALALNYPSLPKDADGFLYDLKANNPALLQTLLRELPVYDSVWDTAFVLKYAPNPQQAWDDSVHWHDYYKGTSPLNWSKKESNQPNCCIWANPDIDATREMHKAMGKEAFALWQYGVYMARLSQNQQTVLTPSGATYNLAAGLLQLEPSMHLGIAPAPETLTLDTVRRYKGQGLVEDMFSGLAHSMQRYEEQRFQTGIDYCAAMFNALVPFAIKEGLATRNTALNLDKQITVAMQKGRLAADVGKSWFQERIANGRDKSPVAFSSLLPRWPKALRGPLLHQEMRIRREKNPTQSLAALQLQCLDTWSFEPAVVQTVLEQATAQEWNDLQKELDSNDATTAVLSMLQTDHPWIQTYKSTPRARIAVVAACMVFSNEETYVHTTKYRKLGGLLASSAQTPLGQFSLPQPLYYFASIFPQYRETWQRLACEMVDNMPHEVNRPKIDTAKLQRDAAKKVINALTSLMLGKSVDAHALLAVRDTLDPNMDYESLIQSQLNTNETFELPSSFNENMFVDGPAQL